MRTMTSLGRDTKVRIKAVCPSCGKADLSGPFSSMSGSYFVCAACQRHVEAEDLAHPHEPAAPTAASGGRTVGVNVAERDPVDVVRLELAREFTGRLSDDTIELFAVEEVAAFADARVRDFVVLLAMRQARARAKGVVALVPGA
jgi:hypothetical protein